MAYQERYTADGFWQFREIYPNGKMSRWRFQIFSFSGEPKEIGTCWVRTRDGKSECAIDGNNRLKIAGKWLPASSWYH